MEFSNMITTQKETAQKGLRKINSEQFVHCTYLVLRIRTWQRADVPFLHVEDFGVVTLKG